MECAKDINMSSLGVEIQDKFKCLIKDISAAYEENPGICIRLLRYLLNKYDIRKYSNDEMEDKSAQTDQTENEECPWKSKNIVDEVTSIAEATVSQTGFVFDRNTGSYYNQSEQCYYIPDYKLYYYVQNKAYYYYDETEKSMKFHSSVDISDEPEPEPHEERIKSPKSSRSPRKKKRRSRSRREEGEWSSGEERRSSRSSRSSKKKSRRSEKSRSRSRKIDKEHCAPCIRLIVKETSLKNLPIGKLFVVTRTGGTLGREGELDVIVPDLNVSKEHLVFRYVRKKGKHFYEVTDLGSKNGTYLNGNRLCEPKRRSEPFELCHSDEITLGSTVLLCHIHDDQTTCQDCEPSFYGFSPESENIVSYTKTTSSKPLREQHRDEMRQIKKKFGLAPVANVKLAKGYEDKAEIRRKKVGSSHSSEKTEVASTDIPLNKKNKGFNMLSKMGWKEGEGVGKTSAGIKAPIDVKCQNGKLGLGAPDIEFALPPVKSSQSLEVLQKVQKRYLDIFEEKDEDNANAS